VKPETIFSHNLVNEFRLQLDEDSQLCRMESNYTQQGIPDIYICYQGVSCWVETKVDDYPLSSLQISWHRQHRRAGGMVFTVTQEIIKGGNKYSLEYDGMVWFFDSLVGVVGTVIYMIEETKHA